MASLEYRRAATQQASVVGLVIALHDTLIGNLTRAADAMDKDNIAARCEELIHGFKVLTQLDAMLDMRNGGEAAVNIRRFYTHVRGRMLEAQFKLDPGVLRDQVRIVLEVREAWEQVDTGQNAELSAFAGSFGAKSADARSAADVEIRSSFSCTG